MRPTLHSVPASDGYALRHRVWDPGDARATLILLNGVMSHSAWFQSIASPLAAAGIKLVGADRRGSGPNEEARGDAPGADILIDDLLRISAAHQAEKRFLLGWCWGAVLALNAADRLDLSGLILVASGLHPTEEVKTRAEAVAGDERVALPIREEMFTKGPALDAFIRADPDRLQWITPRFARTMRRLAVTAAGRMRKLDVPVLSIVAELDEATDSAAAANALPQADVIRLPGAHGVMFEAPEALASTLVRWMEARL